MPGPLPSMRCWSVLEVSVVTVKVMVGAFWPECRGQVRGAIGLCERDTLYLLTGLAGMAGPAEAGRYI